MTQQPSNFQQPYGPTPSIQKPSAQPFFQPTARQRRAREKETTENYTDLLQYWCDPAEIMENQQGRVTFKQRSMLKKSLSLWPTTMCGYVIFLVTVPSLYLAFSTGQYLWLLLLFVPLVLAFYTFALFCLKRLRYSNPPPGSVESMPGEVAWDQHQKSYVARTPMWSVTTASSAPEFPPPGTYQFYCLGRKHILLSAQPTSNSTAGSSLVKQSLQETLSTALAFSLTDLEYNRRGELSPEQHRTLSNSLFWGRIGSIVALLIGASILPIIFYYKGDSGTVVAGIIIGGPIAIGALFSLFFSSPRKYAEINQQTVQSIDGTVRSRKSEGDSDTPDHYYYDVQGGKSFKVSSTAYNALISNLRYRVYYLSTMQKILSIEPIESPWR